MKRSRTSTADLNLLSETFEADRLNRRAKSVVPKSPRQEFVSFVPAATPPVPPYGCALLRPHPRPLSHSLSSTCIRPVRGSSEATSMKKYDPFDTRLGSNDDTSTTDVLAARLASIVVSSRGHAQIPLDENHCEPSTTTPLSSPSTVERFEDVKMTDFLPPFVSLAEL